MAHYFQRSFSFRPSHTFTVSVSKFQEPTCSIHRSVENAYFTRLGFTDASICEITDKNTLVLTADFPLANILEYLGMHVINFNHNRVLGWKESR